MHQPRDDGRPHRPINGVRAARLHPHRHSRCVIKAKAAAGVDDVLDDLCAEVEPLMVDVPGIEDQLEFVGTTMGLSQSLEQPCGEARMTYQIHYQTAAADPGTAL